MPTTIKIKRGPESSIPVLADGEPGFTTDTYKLYVGMGGTNRLINGTGTVTSVALALPSIFSVSGSPVTISGTLTGSLATQAANKVFAGPTTGADAAPTFRSLVAADLPSHSHAASDVTSGTLATARGGTGLDSSGATNGQLLIGNGSGLSLATITAGSGISVTNGSGTITVAAINSGTVTSVGLSLPSIFSVSGSPVTSSGTLSASLAVQNQNNVFVGPSSGGAGTPTFRALVAADIPSHNHSAAEITSGTLAVARGGTGSGSTPSNGQLLIGNGTGFTLATLTGGTGISVTNGSGTITITSTAAVTSITAGTGLSGGTITTSGTIALDVNSLTATDVAIADTLPIYDDSATAMRKLSIQRLGGYLPANPGGRLALNNNDPWGSTDLSARSTLYYTPCLHNRIELWDGTRWNTYIITERSIALSGLTSDKNYDVYAYWNSDSGIVDLETLAWTNNTTRATDISFDVSGRYVKSGDATRLYLGTFRSTSTTTTEDGASRRFLWNMYNRVPRRLKVTESTSSWTYTTASFRQVRASASNMVSVVRGLSIEPVTLTACNYGLNSGAAIILGVGIGLGNTTNVANVFGGIAPLASQGNLVCAYYCDTPALGYQEFWWLEKSGLTTGTTTWYGSGLNPDIQTGMIGWTWG